MFYKMFMKRKIEFHILNGKRKWELHDIYVIREKNLSLWYPISVFYFYVTKCHKLKTPWLRKHHLSGPSSVGQKYRHRVGGFSAHGLTPVISRCQQGLWSYLGSTSSSKVSGLGQDWFPCSRRTEIPSFPVGCGRGLRLATLLPTQVTKWTNVLLFSRSPEHISLNFSPQKNPLFLQSSGDLVRLTRKISLS